MHEGSAPLSVDLKKGSWQQLKAATCRGRHVLDEGHPLPRYRIHRAHRDPRQRSRRLVTSFERGPPIYFKRVDQCHWGIGGRLGIPHVVCVRR